MRSTLAGCRYVSPAHPLAPYSWSEAMGRWLLTELERASSGRPTLRALRHAAGSAAEDAAPGGLAAALQHQAGAPPRFGAFVHCMPLAERDCFLVVSSKVRRNAQRSPEPCKVMQGLLWRQGPMDAGQGGEHR